MYKIISFTSALLLPIIVSVLTFRNVNLINSTNKFLIENTITIIGIILSVNCATALGVFNMFLDRAEKNKIYIKYLIPIKMQIKHNLTLLVVLFFLTILLIMLEKSGIENQYFVMCVNAILIFNLILSGFALWEIVCFYGFGIPPNIADK
ncbi:hypothetical protein [Aquella oligotrophica]|uniref:Uncharacterized protein n=1 Tax=Aquella oligotrophica TaxID=2067065 RepID=A0A2I7N7U6_9NEIS|nr:hypothetical protein [Aquella oligotrophica]AUR52538.1 hypothetical protein CUN60_09585 [Aquella oligotrophica]